MGKSISGGWSRAQLSQIGAEDNGEEILVMVGHEVVIVVALVTLEGVVDLRETHVEEVPLVGVKDLLILLHAMSAGCAAIWHVTVPIRMLSDKVVAVA